MEELVALERIAREEGGGTRERSLAAQRVLLQVLLMRQYFCVCTCKASKVRREKGRWRRSACCCCSLLLLSMCYYVSVEKGERLLLQQRPHTTVHTTVYVEREREAAAMSRKNVTIYILLKYYIYTTIYVEENRRSARAAARASYYALALSLCLSLSLAHTHTHTYTHTHTHTHTHTQRVLQHVPDTSMCVLTLL
jgi:hypothetical protein